MTEADLKIQQEVVSWAIRKSLEKEGFYPAEPGKKPPETEGCRVTLRISGTVTDAAGEEMMQTFLLPPMVWYGERKRRGLMKNQREDILLGRLRLYCQEQLLEIEGKKIPLTRRETDLLVFLLENRNRTVSREDILNAVWSGEYDGNDRAVDGHMKRLRHKMGSYRICIQTVRGLGYRFLWEEKY